MPKVHSFLVSDSFWENVSPLIPKPERVPTKTFKLKPGGGKKPMDSRKIFEAILYFLRTGCQWKALPKERLGSPSSYTHVFQKVAARWNLCFSLACRAQPERGESFAR
jgi:transposase